MKKTLLRTTALVAASFLTLGVANAEVTVSASQTYLVKFASGSKNGAALGQSEHLDDDANKVNQSISIFHDTSNITVTGSGVSDAGLTYGARVDVNTFVGDTDLDESDIYIGGDSWGKISIGQDDDALDGKTVTGVSAAVGYAGTGDAGDDVGGNADHGRIMYSSPNIGGFEAAVSFAPQASGADTVKDSENLIAVGAKFSRDFGNFGASIGGGARIQSFTNRTSAAVNGVAVDGEAGNQTGFQVGAMGTFDAFAVAVGFGIDSMKDDTVHASDTKETTNTYISAGVSYKFGMGGVSLGYYSVSSEVKNVDAIKQSANSIVVDADYKLGEGITALFEAAINSADGDTDKDETSGYVDPSATNVLVGLSASF